MRLLLVEDKDSFRRLLTLTREFAARAANRPNSRR